MALIAVRMIDLPEVGGRFVNGCLGCSLGCNSTRSITTALDVKKVFATDAECCMQHRTTIVGSTIPATIKSSYKSFAALYPKFTLLLARTCKSKCKKWFKTLLNHGEKVIMLRFFFFLLFQPQCCHWRLHFSLSVLLGSWEIFWKSQLQSVD